MKEFSKFEMAAIKRTAQNVKGLMRKKASITLKIESLEKELVSVKQMIDIWEEPIKVLSGGLTSYEILYSEDSSEEQKSPEIPQYMNTSEKDIKCEFSDPCSSSVEDREFTSTVISYTDSVNESIRLAQDI